MQHNLDLLIQTLRDAAKAEIMPRFRSLGAGDVAEKSGFGDLVTLADTGAETMITARLAAGWPDAPVMGEEGTADDPALRDRMATAPLAVVVDPVDGTWNFSRGLAMFGTIAAVVAHGEPLAGVLYDPIAEDWVLARQGQPTVLASPSGSRRLSTATETRPERLNGFLPTYIYPRDLARVGALAGLGYGRMQSLRCSLHEYRLIAQGFADFTLSGPEPHPWDHAAGVLAVIGAGGVARFLDGAPYTLHRRHGVLLAASNEAVWQRVAQDFAALDPA